MPYRDFNFQDAILLLQLPVWLKSYCQSLNSAETGESVLSIKFRAGILKDRISTIISKHAFRFQGGKYQNQVKCIIIGPSKQFHLKINLFFPQSLYGTVFLTLHQVSRLQDRHLTDFVVHMKSGQIKVIARKQNLKALKKWLTNKTAGISSKARLYMDPTLMLAVVFCLLRTQSSILDASNCSTCIWLPILPSSWQTASDWAPLGHQWKWIHP